MVLPPRGSNVRRNQREVRWWAMLLGLGREVWVWNQ
jgi:hypothetical protein